MSVDGRIKSGLRSADGVDEALWQARTNAAYGVVVAGEKRRLKVLRASVSVSVAVAVAVTGFALFRGAQGERTSTVVPPSDNRTRASSTASPLDGTWTSDWLSQGRAERVLDRAGLGAWSSKVSDVIGPLPVRFRMELGGRSLRLVVVHKDGGEFDFVENNFFVTGDRVEVREQLIKAHTTLRWVVQHDALTLSLLEATRQREHGNVPREVYARVLYTTVNFHRLR